MADYVGKQFGNYRLLRQIGSGAFATVYLGEHLYLERPAAVKLLHVQMEPKALEDFLREARTIAHLEHPHIVRVLDFGIESQIPYLVMDYTPNGTLRTRHEKGTRPSFEQIIYYVRQIAVALDYAHEHLVIHRDIKPENILLSARGEITLSDFGIAVVQRALNTLSTQYMAGTPLYMAPEQIRHHPCPASDQYALAVMVYEWLCGEPPFTSPGFAVLTQHLYQEPPGLCARVPGLSPAVEDAVFGALAKDPSRRFATVQDFAMALEEAFFATKLLPVPQAPVPAPYNRPPAPPPVVMNTARPVPAAQPAGPELPHAEEQRTGAASRMSSLFRRNQNRMRLLRRVRSFWIEGVLERSLHGAALLELGLREQPASVSHPWNLILQRSEASSRSFPTGTRITQVYDMADGELLILGAPGAGKTTLLLELARDLLKRAEQDEQHPMPVVLNLSSWAVKQQPLVVWLAEELSSRYQVPPKLAKALVEADQILPLLDGLDEVAVKARTACIEAINKYRLEHGLLSLVVCSRSTDYLAQTARVRLRNAVIVQPLTPQQVMGYLSSIGRRVVGLSAALRHDADLQELATTPLMLNILILAYQGIPLEQIAPLGTLPAKQQQIFATYVQRMLSARSATANYRPEEILTWLRFLAQRLKQRNQTIFYVEYMQPGWLPDAKMLSAYTWLAVHLPHIFIGVLVGLTLYLPFFQTFSPLLLQIVLLNGLLGWLLGGGGALQPVSASQGGRAGGMPWYRPLQHLGLATLPGLAMGLSVWYSSHELWHGLIAGLGFAGCCLALLLLLPGSTTAASNFWTAGTRRPPVRGKVALHALLVGLIFGLSNALSIDPGAGLLMKILNGLLFGVLGALSGGILSALLVGRPATIQLADRLLWTWRSFGRSLFSPQLVRSTLLITGLALLFLSAVFWLGNGPIADILLLGLLVGVGYWLPSGFFRGVESSVIDDRLRTVPNQGIRHSARNTLRYGLVVAVLVGLGCWLYGNWFPPLSSPGGLIVSLNVGLLAGIFNGGLACLRHFVLRFLLWRRGLVPWDYPRFLDLAAECILLRKVGGGYIFLHRLLLDYLAASEPQQPNI